MTREDVNEFVNALREIVQDEGTPVGIDIEVNGIVIGCIQNGRKRFHFTAVTEWRTEAEDEARLFDSRSYEPNESEEC